MGYQASLQRTTAPHTPQPNDFAVFVNDDGATNTNGYKNNNNNNNINNSANNANSQGKGGMCEDSLLQLGRQSTMQNTAHINNNHINNSLGAMPANSRDVYTHTYKLQITAIHTVDDASRL